MTIFQKVYEGVCESGTGPQWGFLTWISHAPAGSVLTIQVRTATTRAELPGAAWRRAGAVPPDPAVCALVGRDGCPRDLFVALGSGPETGFPFLEITFTTSATAVTDAGPTVDAVELSYSCVPNS